MTARVHGGDLKGYWKCVKLARHFAEKDANGRVDESWLETRLSKNPRPKACIVDMSNFIYKILAKDQTFFAVKLFLGKDVLRAHQKIFQLLKNEFNTLVAAFGKKNVHLVFEQMKKKKRKYCYQRVKRRSKIIAKAL